MGVNPLRTPNHRRLGGPLPRQLPNNTHAHPSPMNLYTNGDAASRSHGILAAVSSCFVPVKGRLHTRYAPVRHSCTLGIATSGLTVRLACIKPAASVHPEPGSNSPSYLMSFLFFFVCPDFIACESPKKFFLEYLLHLSSSIPSPLFPSQLGPQK